MSRHGLLTYFFHHKLKSWMNHKHTNALAEQKSPYLLQHAHNPVNWQPWSQTAFDEAKEKDLPLLISIGYATCHWCHVMERESFENEDVAEFLNENFIAIKVDREERPDVDGVYMSAIHRLGEQGGWPLNVFTTPEGVPFYGGTYFPPSPLYGRPSFIQVLSSLAKVWKEDRTRIHRQADSLKSSLEEEVKQTSKTPDLDRARKNYASSLKHYFDHDQAGFKFQQQNKFPPCLHFTYMQTDLRHDKEVMSMVEFTLEAMRKGGIYDQIGGGLSRYSTDYAWLVPHFEKMLYDNALFLWNLAEQFRLTQKKVYSDWVNHLTTYLDRDLSQQETGAFYSAEDADSEGVEGKFYVWTPNEIDKVLNADEATLIKHLYGVTDKGNFEGKNIFFQAMTEEAALKNFEQLSLTEEDFDQSLQQAHAKLLAERNKRIRPLLDDKILTSWNALGILSYVHAGWCTNREDLIDRAQKAESTITQNCWKEGLLYRRLREGEVNHRGTLVDYATLAWAELLLYQVSLDLDYLNKAIQLTDLALDFFLSEHGAFYTTDSRGEKLILRQIDDYDGVEPSGNSVMAHVLLKLFHYTGEEKYNDSLQHLFNYFGESLENGIGLPIMLQALALAHQGLKEITIVSSSDEDVKMHLDACRGLSLSEFVVGVKRKAAIDFPAFIQERKMMEKTSAYVCQNKTCSLPVVNVDELKKILS